MMVIVFRARRTPEGLGDEYQYWFKRMSDLAITMPGYISHKGYVAEDGERLSLFEWESAESLKDWAQHPEHVPTNSLGAKSSIRPITFRFAKWCRNRNLRVIAALRSRGTITLTPAFT